MVGRIVWSEDEKDNRLPSALADVPLEAEDDDSPYGIASRGGVRDAGVASPLHLGVAGNGQLGREIAAPLAEQLLQGESELEPGEACADPALEAEETLGHVADRSACVSVRSEGVAEVRPEANPGAAERAPAAAAAEIDDVGAGRSAEQREGSGGGECDFHEGAA